jgi:glycosyltransferase involved in cell wall biosynthesis
LFVVAANLVRQKGHGDYLKAAAILEKSRPGCFHLFAGSGDPTDLKFRAKELGIDKQIVFAGFRQDMPDVYAASTASVFPGFAGEGVSGVLRESLACGRAVITTNVGGNAELIKHETYGLVVPRQNPEELAKAMARFLDEPEFLNRLAKQGREFVVENHSVDARNRRIFELYFSILEKKKGQGAATTFS